MAFTNNGTISGFGLFNSDLINNNLIDVSGGLREINGNLSSTLSGGGTIAIEATGTLQLDGAASGNKVNFKAATGTLTILQLRSVASTFDIVNISSTDVIRLPNAPLGFGLNYNTNTGTLAITSGGVTVGDLVFTPSASLSTTFLEQIVATNTTAAAYPAIAVNGGVTLAVGGTGTITSGALLATETGDTPSQLTYLVANAPADGVVLKNGATVTTFTQADINAGLVAYQENGNIATSDAIAFRVTDQNGNSIAGSFPVTITGTAKPVLAVNAGVTVAVGGTGTITSGALLATETGDTPSQLTYSVTSAPADGVLLKNGSAITTFTQADINAGSIAYLENGSAATSDAIAFRVTDQNGNFVTELFPVTIAISTTTSPVLAVNTGATVAVGGTGTITSSALLATETGDAPSQLTYSVTGAPADGIVMKNSSAVATFTQADINAGSIVYQENGTVATPDAIAFRVTDQNGGFVTGSFPITITNTTAPTTDYTGLVNAYYKALLRVPPSSDVLQTDITDLVAGSLTTSQLLTQLLSAAQASTVPALMCYDFMVGVTPGSSGVDYLTTYASDLQTGNYTFTGGFQLGTTPGEYSLPQFSVLNTYVNFCATDVQIAGNPFTAAYGALSTTASTANRTTFFNEVYQQVFGSAPATSTTDHFVNDLVASDALHPGQPITVFQFYVDYAGSELGAYGAIAGVLLWTAETSSPQLGPYPGPATSFLTAAATSGAAGSDTAPYGRSLLTAFPASTASQALAQTSAAAINSADPNVITVTDSHQLIDPGVGNHTIRFATGTSDDSLVLHANSVDQVSGFDPTMNVLDLRSLLSESGVNLNSDIAALSSYLAVVDQGADALVRFDPTGQGGGSTVAVLQGLGGTIANLSTLIADGTVRIVSTQS